MSKGADREFFEWVVETLEAAAPGPDDASVFHRYIERRFRDEGMDVEREVRIARGPTRSGRLDLVVSWPDIRKVAIEIDWLKPRFKSLQKLRNFAGYRIVVLRRAGAWPYQLSGIDAVVCIPAIDPVEAFNASQKVRNK